MELTLNIRFKKKKDKFFLVIDPLVRYTKLDEDGIENFSLNEVYLDPYKGLIPLLTKIRVLEDILIMLIKIELDCKIRK